MLQLPRLTIALLVLTVFLLGCGVQSKHKTRSFMSDEEKKAIDAIYNPPEEEKPEEEKPPGFLEGLRGTAMNVNGFAVDVADIRALYEYYASFKTEDPRELKRKVCAAWINAYVAMSQWKDTRYDTQERLSQIRKQVEGGADFGYLIVENSQEPGADKSGGDVGTIARTADLGLDPIFEMHAFTDPVGEVVGPFPTVFGWHLIQVLDRDDKADPPTTHVRHLLLFHGLKPENADLIRKRINQWAYQADIKVTMPELYDVLPEYSPSETTQPGNAPQDVPVSG